MHLHYRPHTLREAFNLTLEFEKEYQITQPQSDFEVMETCHKDLEDYEFSMEEVQMRSQAQNNTQGNRPQGQYQQVSWPQGQGQNQYYQGNRQQYQKQPYPRQYNNQNSNQGNQYWNNYNQGHKTLYQQGAKKYQNNQPQQSNVFQGQGQVVNPVTQLPRIDCGIVNTLTMGIGAVHWDGQSTQTHWGQTQASEELQISTESQQ